MRLDYTGIDYVLTVDPFTDNVTPADIMLERGLDYSTTDSRPGNAVLFTKDAWAVADMTEHATPRAASMLKPMADRIALSQAKGSNSHFRMPMDKELWPFQKASLDYVLSRNQSLIADHPGLGKTPQAIVYANEIGAKRVLVLCPAAIRLQWARKIREWSTMKWPFIIYPVINSKNGIHPTAEWTVISFALARNPALVAAVAQSRYDLLIIDECFPAGTLVETEHGPLPIERIVEDRLRVKVWSYGPKGLVLKAVTRYVKTSSERLVKVRHSDGEFVCTANHRIWTEDGYVAAENLVPGAQLRVVRPEFSPYPNRKGHGRTVPVLQPSVLGQVEVCAQAAQPRAHDKNAEISSGGQTTGRQREDEAPQFRPGISRQTGRYLQVAERRVVDWPAGRQRLCDRAAEEVVRGAWLAGYTNGVGDSDGAGQGYVSEPAVLLQSGLGLPDCKNSNRSGRFVSPEQEVEVFGRSQNCRAGSAWVESVEIYEQAGERGTTVYNLEVEGNHNYFADRVLVGNCHYLKDSDASQTKAVFGDADGLYHFKRGQDAIPAIMASCAHTLCLSGTPLVNRPLEAYTTTRNLCWDAIDYMSFEKFRVRYNPQKTKFLKDNKRVTDERIGRVRELGNRMRGMFMARHSKREVMDQLKMPKYEVIQVEETGAVRAALQAESLLGLDIDTIQTTNDYRVLGHIAQVRREMGIAIAPQAADYVKLCLDGGEDKIVVFGWHIEVLDKLQEMLASYGVLRIDGSTSPKKRQHYVDVFQKDPAMRVMLGNIQSMGTGVDGLQEVATHCVLVEPTWTPGENQQAVDRLDRGGQKGHVQADFLVAPGSILEKILVSALEKAVTIHKTIG